MERPWNGHATVLYFEEVRDCHVATDALAGCQRDHRRTRRLPRAHRHTLRLPPTHLPMFVLTCSRTHRRTRLAPDDHPPKAVRATLARALIGR